MDQPTELFGCRVVDRIGEGAGSRIYVVIDADGERRALKHVRLVDPRDRRFYDQIVQEHAVGASTQHASIRRTHVIRRRRRALRLVEAGLLMEMVYGEPLTQLVHLDLPDLVSVFAQAADGFARLHREGWAHADIKPSNIMVTARRAVKLIDFGQSCRIGEVKSRVQGTPGFIAPEQAHGGAITARTDIYNFGASMYWALVGETIQTTLASRKHESSLLGGAIAPDRLPPPIAPHEIREGVPEDLSEIVLRCVEVDPRQRPTTMSEIGASLRRLAA